MNRRARVAIVTSLATVFLLHSSKLAAAPCIDGAGVVFDVCSTCTYNDLATAVAAASQGDIIEIRDSGVYNESFAPDKSLTLRVQSGLGYTPTINGGGSYGIDLTGVPTCGQVAVQGDGGLTVTSGTSAVYATGACGSIKAEDTYFTTSGSWVWIIYLWYGSSFELPCEFNRCKIDGVGGAIVNFAIQLQTVAVPSPTAKFHNCLIYNIANTGAGLAITGSQTSLTCEVVNCTIGSWGNGLTSNDPVSIVNSFVGGGFFLSDAASYADVSYSAFVGSDPGGCGPGCIFDVNPANEFVGDYHLKAGANCIENGTDTSAWGVLDDLDKVARPQDSFYDIGAYEYISGGPCIDGAGVVFDVCSTCAYNDLATAVAAASQGDIIEIRDSGVYNESFAPDKSLTLRVQSGMGYTPTINGGASYGIDLTSVPTCGQVIVQGDGGLTVTSGTSAVYATGACGSIKAEDTYFTTSGSWVWIIYLWYGSSFELPCEFDRCMINGNSPTVNFAIQLQTVAAPSPSAKLRNCLIYNIANTGAGLAIMGAQTGLTCEVVNCTIDSFSNGLTSDDPVSVVNSFVGGGFFLSDAASYADVSYSAFQGADPGGCGPGCIFGVNPDDEFVDRGNDNYHLKAGADCIENGTDTSAWGVLDDLDKVARPQDSFYDIGAYEYFSGGPGTDTPTPTWTLTNTKTHTPTESPSHTLSYTATSTWTPTVTETITLTPSTSASATHSPTVTPTSTASVTPTDTPTWTLTSTPTDTVLPSLTSTPTASASITLTATASTTPSRTESITETRTLTTTESATTTATLTATPSITETASPSASHTLTYSTTVTRTATGTLTPSVTRTQSATDSPTASPSATPTSTLSLTQSMTATDTLTISETATPTATISVTLTVTETATASASHTETVTLTTTKTVTESITPTTTATATPTITKTATASASHTKTDTATVTPSATETNTLSGTYTSTPTVSTSDTPTTTESITRTCTETDTPTNTPTMTESATPIDTGTTTPSATETATPSASHTKTSSTSVTPSITETATGTATPTTSPTASASATPSGSHTGTSTYTPLATATVTPTITETATASTTYTQTATPTATPTATRTSTVTLDYSYTVTPTHTTGGSCTSTSTATPTLTPGETVIEDHGFYPNPYTEGEGYFTFLLRGPASEVRLKVFTVSSRRIICRTKVDTGYGTYQYFEFDGKNDHNRKIANGIYLYLIEACEGDEVLDRKIGKLVVLR